MIKNLYNSEISNDIKTNYVLGKFNRSTSDMNLKYGEDGTETKEKKRGRSPFR